MPALLFRIVTKIDTEKQKTIITSPFVFPRLEAERRCKGLNKDCKGTGWDHQPVPDSNYKANEVWTPNMTLFEVKNKLLKESTNG